MGIKEMKIAIGAEIVELKLKVETTYCRLVEAGKDSTADVEMAYLNAIDELNAKIKEAKALMGSWKMWVSKNRRPLMVGGAVMFWILMVILYLSM